MTQRRILVVDDEQDILSFLEKELGAVHSITTALGGAAAIPLLSKKKFDIVLTDMRMPDVDGIQVLKMTRTLQPGTEVVFMSGFADLDSVIEAMNEGGFAFITKPILVKNLWQRLNAALAVIQSR